MSVPQKDVRLKKHYSHKMNPLSVAANRKSTRRQKTRKMQMLELLAVEAATIRMMAKRLGCQSSDLSKPGLELRKQGRIVSCKQARDPVTNYKATYWKIPQEGEFSVEPGAVAAG